MIFFIGLLFSGILFAQESFKCEGKHDALGIPHEEVRSLEELYFCFGYHHGKDRAWEMDYFRRVAQGRNAEVLGFSQLKSDLMMRLLNLPAKARELWRDFPSDKKRMIEIYARGANEGFKLGQGAHEFKDLGYYPDPWKPEDSLLVLLVQSFDQTRKTFFRDYEEQKAREHWGDKAEELFNHDEIPWENTILKEGEYPKRTLEKKTTRQTRGPVDLWAKFPEVFGEESGSNSWVLSRNKTMTGSALLANDPHLDLKTPLFWYWIHLKSPKAELIGGSVPGVPLVASGTNGQVAWGLTNAYINTADAVFLSDVKSKDVETIRPVVWVKFWFFKLPFFFKTFERLKEGNPVLPLETQTSHPIALKWTGFKLLASEMAPMFDLLTIKNVTEMDHLLKEVQIPAWNFVFADTQGDIGYRVVGKIYRQTEKTPFGIPLLTKDEFFKEDYLSAEDKPHALKPRRNYIYTANNRHWPQDAAFYGGRGYSHSFRGYRIDQRLQAQQSLDLTKSIQCDRLVVDAQFFIPKIARHILIDPLLAWNQLATDDSKELSLYRRLMDIMMEEWKVDEYSLFRLLDVLDEKKIKDLKDFYQRAVADVGARGWADFHRLGFTHLSKNLSWVFSPEIPGVGDNHTVDPGTSKWNPDKKIYEQSSGASMRMIVELTSRPKIYLALPGLNRDYTQRGDQIPWQDWKDCKYSEVEF
jgi:penicillin G amidase